MQLLITKKRANQVGAIRVFKVWKNGGRAIVNASDKHWCSYKGEEVVSTFQYTTSNWAWGHSWADRNPHNLTRNSIGNNSLDAIGQ
jgi:hypothetical protein